MNDLKEQLNRIDREIFILEMKDRFDSVDFDNLRELQNKRIELKNQLDNASNNKEMW